MPVRMVMPVGIGNGTNHDAMLYYNVRVVQAPAKAQNGVERPKWQHRRRQNTGGRQRRTMAVVRMWLVAHFVPPRRFAATENAG
jgi:hypothetical protein